MRSRPGRDGRAPSGRASTSRSDPRCGRPPRSSRSSPRASSRARSPSSAGQRRAPDARRACRVLRETAGIASGRTATTRGVGRSPEWLAMSRRLRHPASDARHTLPEARPLRRGLERLLRRSQGRRRRDPARGVAARPARPRRRLPVSDAARAHGARAAARVRGPGGTRLPASVPRDREDRRRQPRQPLPERVDLRRPRVRDPREAELGALPRDRDVCGWLWLFRALQPDGLHRRRDARGRPRRPLRDRRLVCTAAGQLASDGAGLEHADRAPDLPEPGAREDRRPHDRARRRRGAAGGPRPRGRRPRAPGRRRLRAWHGHDLHGLGGGLREATERAAALRPEAGGGRARRPEHRLLPRLLGARRRRAALGRGHTAGLRLLELPGEQPLDGVARLPLPPDRAQPQRGEARGRRLGAAGARAARPRPPELARDRGPPARHDVPALGGREGAPGPEDARREGDRMTVSRPIEPITEDDAAIAAALADAHLPSLLPALAQGPGHLSLLRPALRPDPSPLVGDPSGLAGPEAAEEARKLAQGVLIRFRDGGCRRAPAPDEPTVRRILGWMTGAAERELDAYLPIVQEELAIASTDLRAPSWKKADVAPDMPFLVAVIGAGMSGILAGVRLGQAGVPYVILEKNDEVGGTWYENVYPGCRVDVANHFYSYSFAQKDDWPHHFSTQPALLDYFRDCAEEFGVREHVRFRTEVLSAIWSDERRRWSLRLRGPDGREETLEADAVISAVGQLNQPKLPDIPGRERFRGPSFHSARWDTGLRVRGKRVAVIGTGASAAQLVPAIAGEVAELTIFQRTPNWLLPAPDYHAEVPAGLRWLFSHVPHYSHWHRFWLFWRTGDGMFLPLVRVDPSWPHRDRAVSAGNDGLCALLAQAIQAQVPDDPELRAKVVPHYPPASKRILVDNGAWLRALQRENVHLITDEIAEIDERGVVLRDGTHHHADVIVYATGFQASRFLTPMRVVGRGGVDLHRRWDGNARAYLGITIPGFPNFFCLYGPNTNIVVNGSITYFSECEVRYVLGCLRLLLEGRHRAMSPREDVHDAYNARIDEGNSNMAWGVSKVNSWYKSPSGRVAQNWPFTLLEYWQQTREPDPADYEWA